MGLQHPSSPHNRMHLQTPSSQSRHPQVVIKRSPHTPQGHVRRSPHAPPKVLPTDLTVLLLDAADEYINAAHSMGSMAAISRQGGDLSHYCKLMTTGLACMEAILKRYNQTPRDEAKLRLRYASLLIEETENDVEIEEVLSKGVCMIPWPDTELGC